MPGSEIYEISAMTIMKRGDDCCKERVIKAVKFQFSYDDGQTWNTHNKGKWYETGMIAADN
jgi:translation elongation factor P/translation initiation factor 5A